MNVADIDILCEDASIIKNVLDIESERDIPRTKITLGVTGNILKVHIEARDINALRAAITSYMRWIGLSMKVMEMIEDG